MIGKFLLIMFVILSFALFNNIFFPRGIGRGLFDNSSSVLLLTAISVVLFVLVMFVLEAAFGTASNINRVIEGTMIGWIVALFLQIKKSRY
ncbi:hypothetical protein Curi_c24530 [Gottschalkia acidurici 9a]|uniref:Uncharacterized protein n=1 Tax=Gottschalkia acidurici (strain ATCC 7906 / DSM 604 / BCRC 14475 / CIP 104303 / KCTC 5404 / NCIMB 10678 / 9a) TaxID=1128398 RepID=K0B089_GOTA9|nr:hypothetical protein [Gottschalkia acidurici]AFS79448.1 hypothetical protein Curi_c24530 [Gottschalkia acidurici 9a]